jgi:hypothetical protein
MLFKSRNRIRIKTNVLVVSRPKIPVFSNGALVSNIIYRKMDKTIPGNCVLAFNRFFQNMLLNLHKNQVHHSKEPKSLVKKHHGHF